MTIKPGYPGVQKLGHQSKTADGLSAAASVTFGTVPYGSLLLMLTGNSQGGAPAPGGASWSVVASGGRFTLWRATATPGGTGIITCSTGANGTRGFAFAGILMSFESAADVSATFGGGDTAIPVPSIGGADYLLAAIMTVARGQANWSPATPPTGWWAAGDPFVAMVPLEMFNPGWVNISEHARVRSQYDGNGASTPSAAGSGVVVMAGGQTELRESWGLGAHITAQRYGVTINQIPCPQNGSVGSYTLSELSTWNDAGTLIDPTGAALQTGTSYSSTVTRNTYIAFLTHSTSSVRIKQINKNGVFYAWDQVSGWPIREPTVFDIYWECSGPPPPPPPGPMTAGSFAWITN